VASAALYEAKRSITGALEINHWSRSTVLINRRDLNGYTCASNAMK
jgi:hypothetical protein